jgi:uncharacterized membrane protein
MSESMNKSTNALVDKSTKRLDFAAIWPILFFCIFLLTSAFCMLSRLNSRELWLDETYSVFVANLRLPELMRMVIGDLHPPLYYLVLWAWIRIAGDGQSHLRLLGAILNICCALGMFFLARRVLGPRFGALASALFCTSPMLFIYSVEVRMYMLTVLLFVYLLLVHWIVVVEQNESNWLAAAYSVLGAALFYVHYIGVFLLLGLLVHWIFNSPLTRKTFARMCATGVSILVLISPWIPIMLAQRAAKARLDQAVFFSHQNPNALAFGVVEQNLIGFSRIKRLATSAAAMSGYFPSKSHLLLMLCAIPITLAIAGAWYLCLKKRDEVCRLFCIIQVAMGIAVVLLHLQATRYLLSLIPLLVLAIVRTVQFGANVPRWRLPSLTVGTLVLCIYCAGYFRQAIAHHDEPWQTLVNSVRQNYQPGDRVVFEVLYAQVPFDYFARQAHFQPSEEGFPVSIYDWWNGQEYKAWGGPVITHADLNKFDSELSESGVKTLWVVSYETNYYDPHNLMLERLRQLGTLKEFTLPLGADASASQDESPLRLIRISLP